MNEEENKPAEAVPAAEQQAPAADAASSSCEPLPAQPPVDNDHVAEGCEKFSEEVVAANAPAEPTEGDVAG